MMKAGPSPPRLVDIAFNACAAQYQGRYASRADSHAPDLPAVLARASAAGVSLLLTGSDLPSIRHALTLTLSPSSPSSSKDSIPLKCTAGIHPCSAPPSESVLAEQCRALLALHTDHPRQIVALGELGLDYDRLQHASADVQRRAFHAQLQLEPLAHLPMFLHSRAAHRDFVDILSQHRERPMNGCVHSFTGTEEEAQELLSLGLSIGINGCSLRTEDGLNLIRTLPKDRIMLETDAPWCSISTTSPAYPYLASMPDHLRQVYMPTRPGTVKAAKWTEGCTVKGRNEPIGIGSVAWVVACVRQETVEDVAQYTTQNAERMWGPLP